MPVTLVDIEKMIADLLPLVDGKPDIKGVGTPDIAQTVLQSANSADTASLQVFFNRRTNEEGWHEIAVVLAKSLITVDKEHRKIIMAINDEGSTVGI